MGAKEAGGISSGKSMADVADLFENLLPWLSELERKKLESNLEFIRKEIRGGNKKKVSVLALGLAMEIMKVRNDGNSRLLEGLERILLAANS